ncbi:MAG: fatty acid desaturase [Acidimicrobiales bacterium]
MTAILEGAVADGAIRRLRARAQIAPPVAELGDDLRLTSHSQLTLAVGRPLFVVSAYAWASFTGHWLIAVLLVPIVFLANVVIVHDLMHRSLGLQQRTNSMLLGLLALLMLDSGHALQATHAAHHRQFPGPGDPEAYMATWSVWRVLLEGPRYRYRLWAWAWRSQATHRATLFVEFAVHVAIVTGAAVGALQGSHRALSVYVAVGLVGSWLFPLISVTAVHDAHGVTPFQQSKTVRGRIVPASMLGMGYHLEHHLWPMIPSHHLAETARRTQEILDCQQARIVRVP